tara:strand:- start:257 stop:424 length:168 start_codon:yes stop_codon:yes gene_type:complete
MVDSKRISLKFNEQLIDEIEKYRKTHAARGMPITMSSAIRRLIVEGLDALRSEAR